MGSTGEGSPILQSPFLHSEINDPGEMSKNASEQDNSNLTGFEITCCNKNDKLSVRKRNVMRGRLIRESEGEQTCSEEGLRGMEDPYAKCTSSTTRSHNSRNLFSLGNGLILILLFLLYWTCLVHGGFPGRGPPPPRGPPLLAHHPLAPGGPHPHGHSRNSPFSRRRHPPPPPHHHPHHPHRHGPPPKSGKLPKSSPPSDLAVAAQTLYDLRGYHIPVSGPEAPRFHRQNDPFTLPTPMAQNPRERGVHHLPQDTRTAPLVFPSFYQEQPTPTPTRSSIFGHNQHLSQTRFEPPGSFHLGGNSASTKITLEQQSSSTRDQFRPSQIDISLHNNQVQSTPIPVSPSPFAPQPQVPSSLAPEKKNFPSTARTRAPVKLSKNQQQDPFVYVYDEVDYDEGEDSDFSLGGGSRQRTPQGQINSNRITPSTSTTTTAPLRSREPTIVPTPSPFPTLHSPQQQQQPQYLHQAHQALYSTSTTTKQPTTTQNNIYYNPQKDDFRDPFRDSQGIIRPPVTARPNVEIVPSSERKPPPDQSNAIVPALSRLRNEGRDYNRGAPVLPVPPQSQHHIPLINDNFRRPVLPHSTTTTTLAPPTTVAPHYQRESIYNIQPQGRQVSPHPPQTPVPYFPAGLDRRPFETQNEIPSTSQTPVRNGQTQHHFDQVVNLLQEEEEQYPSQNNNNPGENLLEHGYNTPSKLRPVNTIIPKNRIPKEDILLPPNFHFTHGQDNTTPVNPFNHQDISQRGRGDPTQQRVREQNQVTRIREEIPRIRNEVTRAPQRNAPNQQQVRSRPSVIFPDDYDDDNQNFINNQQHHSQVITEPSSPSPPTRTRVRQPQRTTTTTTTAAPIEQSHQRTRTPSPRQRLRPNYNRQSTTSTTTTTTTTTTTPAPTYVEYPSQEYLDDYENPRPQYQHNSPPPPQIVPSVVPQQQQKPLSRFPPFPGKSKEVDSTTTPQSPPLQRQRPQVTSQERPQGRQRPEGRGKGNRFRETTTQDSTTSPRTTGKPLYTTGKMLSKEGGLYAGQRITSSHVYGQPIPNIPINSVLDKMPGVLDGRTVVLATTKPSFGSPQKHLRSKQRPQPEHGPPKRVRPTPRAQQENTLDIVETVTLKPVDEQPKRLRAGNQFIRGQGASAENNNGRGSQNEALPRRRKVRPGPRRHQQQQVSSTGAPADPYTETVSIHPPRGGARGVDDEENQSFQTERAQILREPSVETTTSVSTSPRSRRPRPPRPGGRPNFSSSQQQENTSERSRESASSDDQEDKPQKPVKKLRPRLRPVPQLSPQQQRGLPSEVVTQSQSAQVDRKPTDAPGRFSSRFRDDEPETSTAVSTSSGRFSPPTARPTFKPPPPSKKNVPRNKRPKEQHNGGSSSDGDGSDELPDSIKLSPKDVIANRKPARRIPPGSASDRLKALQQRRNKVFGKPSQQQDGEETAEGRQVPVTKRPRLKSVIKAKPPADEDQQLPQPQRLRRPTQQQQRHQSQEASGSKREIVNRNGNHDNRVKPPRNDVDYYNDKEEDKDDFEEEDNSEYTNDEPGSSSPAPLTSTSTSSVTPQTERAFVTVTSRPVRPNNGGFHRNKSVEVTSDEARSVLGIPRPASPNRVQGAKRLRIQQQQRPIHHQDENEDEDEQEEEEAERQQFRQRPRFNNRPRQRANNDEREGGGKEFNTVQPEFQHPRQLQKPRPGPGRLQPQQRPRQHQRQQLQREEENTEEEQDVSEYRDDEADNEDKEEPARKPYLQNKINKQYISSSTFSPSPQILRKKLNTNNNRNTAELEEENEENEEDAVDEDVEVSSPAPSSERTTITSTSTSSTSTSTSKSTSPFPLQSSTAERLPVALPVRAGPQPIKQGVLKARLRPNKRLNGVGGGNGGPQPRVSITASTTQATITTTESRKVGRGDEDDADVRGSGNVERRERGDGERRERGDGERRERGNGERRDRGDGEGLKHGTIHVSKSHRPRLHGGGGRGGKRKEKKFIAMATENPSLPLESIFPEMS